MAIPAYPATDASCVYVAGADKFLDAVLQDGAIERYVCTTTGTVHALVGHGHNIKFVADANFAAGNTFVVNGKAVAAQTPDGQSLEDGAFAAGAVVNAFLEGNTLNFRLGGGLPSAAKALLVPENIRAGVHIKGGGVDVTGAVMPYTVPGNKTVGLMCFNRSSWWGCGSPYFDFENGALICRAPCTVTISMIGKTDSGNIETTYGRVYLNKDTIINSKHGGGWNVQGSIEKSLSTGDVITAGYAGAGNGGKESMKIALILNDQE